MLFLVVRNHAELAAEATSDDVVRAHIAQVLSAADSAVRLTRQVLTFARREPVQVELLDLDEVVEDVRSILASSLGPDIQLVVRPGADAALLVDRIAQGGAFAVDRTPASSIGVAVPSGRKS